MQGIADWLASIGLNEYAQRFAENAIDVSDLHRLTEQDLQNLGIPAQHRRQILNAITQLGGTVAEVPTAADVSQHNDAERRQLTIMFCDLVGSTALSERLDPEDLRSLLHAYRTLCGDVIARYDGFVARYVGDGILTYFGWPTAHEEDAERAVLAALEIVQSIKRASTTEELAVRIGIATGPVVVGEAAGVGDQSKLAVGSTPNLAARLQALAVADQIVVAASTRRLVGNVFKLTDLGEQYRRYGLGDPEAEEAMAGSLRRWGQLSPVVACERAGRLELIDGFKRLSAARQTSSTSSVSAVPWASIEQPPINRSSNSNYPSASSRRRAAPTISGPIPSPGSRTMRGAPGTAGTLRG